MLAKAVWACWELRRKSWYKKFPFLPLPELAYLDSRAKGRGLWILSYSQAFFYFLFESDKELKEYVEWRREVKRLKSP